MSRSITIPDADQLDTGDFRDEYRRSWPREAHEMAERVTDGVSVEVYLDPASWLVDEDWESICEDWAGCSPEAPWAIDTAVKALSGKQSDGGWLPADELRDYLADLRDEYRGRR